MINTCFLSGLFPDPLNYATVILIYKKGKRTNITNYRLIALLPFLGMIFERSTFNLLSNYAMHPSTTYYRLKNSVSGKINQL